MPTFVVPQSRVTVSLTSSETLVIAKTMALISELTILDTHWTRTAISLSGKKDDAGLDDLGRVVSNLDSLLVQSQPYFASTAEIFAARAEELRGVYHGIIFDDPVGPEGLSALTPAQREQLQAIIDSLGGDFAVVVIEAARRLASDDRVASERKAIQDEFSKIRAGNQSDGDFSGDQWGDIMWVSIGASAAFGPEAGAVIMGVAGLIDLVGSIFR